MHGPTYYHIVDIHKSMTIQLFLNIYIYYIIKIMVYI